MQEEEKIGKCIDCKGLTELKDTRHNTNNEEKFKECKFVSGSLIPEKILNVPLKCNFYIKNKI